MKSYKAIIVEDKTLESRTLTRRLNTLFPQIEVIAICDTLSKAKISIDSLHPQILFLDIDIGTDNGFDLLDQLAFKSFKVIFTTGHDDMAMKAFDVSAVHYLLKPYDDTDLIEAVRRSIVAIENESATQISNKIDDLLENLKGQSGQSKIFIITNEDGDHRVQLADIIFCSTIKHISANEKQGVRIVFRLLNRPSIVVSNESITHYAELLTPYQFIKVAASCIVNLNHILVYKRKGSDLIMKAYKNDQGKMIEEEIGINDNYKHAFNTAYNQFSKNL